MTAILTVAIFGLVLVILSLRTMLLRSRSQWGLQTDTLFGQSEYSTSEYVAAASDIDSSPVDSEDTR